MGNDHADSEEEEEEEEDGKKDKKKKKKRRPKFVPHIIRLTRLINERVSAQSLIYMKFYLTYTCR